SLFGLATTSLLLWRIPSYSYLDFQVLAILFVFLIIVRGLEQNGIVAFVARTIRRQTHLGFTLVIITAFLSIFITNDVALLTIVPLTLELQLPRERTLIALETVVSNAASVLTPFGNPQNLLIFYFYNLSVGQILLTIAPIAAIIFVLTLFWSRHIRTTPDAELTDTVVPDHKGMVYLSLFVLFCLAVVRFLPLIVGIVPVVYALVKDREALRIDYGLLLTFVAFFGFTDNMMQLFSLTLSNSTTVFFTAVLVSQIVSNVPATLLLIDFTTDWSALLWGVSVGGFGLLFGSMASIISYQLYARKRGSAREYLVEFHKYSIAALFIGIIMFLLVFV
ncbi:MAG: SLC13 family permease, partial [Candidatus Thorarchaeota archaeon]